MAEAITMTVEEMMEKAKSADLVDLIRQHGYSLEGNGDLKRITEFPHIVVDTAQNAYMDYGTGKGGSPVDFIAQRQGMDRETAAQRLCEKMEAGSLKTYFNPKAFISPEKHETNKHIYAYLTQEKSIDGEVVNNAINRGNLYETRNEYMNADGELKQQYRCVFVGMDTNRNVKNAVVQAAYEMESQKPFQYQVRNSDINSGFNMYGKKVQSLFLWDLR